MDSRAWQRADRDVAAALLAVLLECPEPRRLNSLAVAIRASIDCGLLGSKGEQRG